VNLHDGQRVNARELRRRRGKVVRSFDVGLRVVAFFLSVDPVEPVGVIENPVRVAGRGPRSQVDQYAHVQGVGGLHERAELQIHVGRIVAEQAVVQGGFQLEEILGRVWASQLALAIQIAVLDHGQEIDGGDAHALEQGQYQNGFQEGAGFGEAPVGQVAVAVVVPGGGHADEEAVKGGRSQPVTAAPRSPAGADASVRSPHDSADAGKAASAHLPAAPPRQNLPLDAVQQKRPRVQLEFRLADLSRVGEPPGVPEDGNAVSESSSGARLQASYEAVEVIRRSICHVLPFQDETRSEQHTRAGTRFNVADAVSRRRPASFLQ